MKIKNINLSILIISGLVVLSFAFYIHAQEKTSAQNNIFLDSDQDGLTDQEEALYGTDPHNPDTDGDGYSDGAEIKSGYDPLKPAPGDRIVPDDSSKDQKVSATSGDTSGADETNLTKQIAQKISNLTSATSSGDQQVSLDDISNLVNQSLTDNTSQDSLPAISKDDIKIKKQNYSKLSDKEAQDKKKEDFLAYISAVCYIMSSNSPQPITSSQDISSVTSSITENIISALDTHDTKNLDKLSQSGDKMLEQLKEVEVPEELVEIHTKALSFALYAKELEKNINPRADDPMGDIANLSKIEGFITSLSSFSEEVGNKFTEYNLTYDDLKSKLDNYGIDTITDQDFLKKLSE